MKLRHVNLCVPGSRSGMPTDGVHSTTALPFFGASEASPLASLDDCLTVHFKCQSRVHGFHWAVYHPSD